MIVVWGSGGGEGWINDVRKKSWRSELDACAAIRGLGGVQKAAVAADRNSSALASFQKQPEPYHWHQPFPRTCQACQGSETKGPWQPLLVCCSRSCLLRPFLQFLFVSSWHFVLGGVQQLSQMSGLMCCHFKGSWFLFRISFTSKEQGKGGSLRATACRDFASSWPVRILLKEEPFPLPKHVRSLRTPSWVLALPGDVIVNAE